MPRIVLGLGANIGDRHKNLSTSIQQLVTQSILTDCRLASLYETPALMTENAPESWNLPFLNTALYGITHHTPLQLLQEIQKVEESCGKKRRGYWAPREIDIDILAYEQEVINMPQLTIPHPHLLKRNFALLPLQEVWPDWHYPVPGEFYDDSATQLASLLYADQPCQQALLPWGLEVILSR